MVQKCRKTGRTIVGWTKYRRLKGGRVIYAASYGLKAFPIYKK
tara:strand:- start:1209 stop:1337 length:129 start_codon:yes stop_codon:yes gene_type:complete